MHRDPQPAKMFTIAPMYRYGAPGKGRYREHWQASVEAIGSDDPSIDAELIQLYDTLLAPPRRHGLPPRAQLDRLPRPAVPPTSRRSRAWLADNEHRLDADTRAKVATSPLRVFDNYLAKPEAVRAALDEAPKIGESLCEECVAHFAAVAGRPRRDGCRVHASFRLSSEASTTTRARPGSSSGRWTTRTRRISGGGRYDGLVEEIGGPPTPGVGFGAGLERLLIAMEDAGVTGEAPTIDVFFALEQGAPRHEVARWLAELRRGGRRRRHGLRRPVAEGAADPGRRGSAPLRPSIVGPDGAVLRRHGQRRRTAGPRRRRRQTVPHELARPHVRGAPRGARRLAQDACGLGRPPPRPRRPRLRRSPRPHRDHPARDQPASALPRRPSSPRRSATSSSSRQRGRSSRAPPETVNPNIATGVGRAPGRHARGSSRARRRCRSSSTRRTSTRRCGCATAGSTSGARSCSATSACAPRWWGSSAGTMEAAGFLDIQTPILYKSTPEGARDFVVPSRLHKGTFFALPQSPQLLKQLTMIAGFDRYYQIAICFRDEDLRADRVQEITQLDMEMSFPDRDELFLLMEDMFAAIWRECLGIEIPRPFPHMTYAEADDRFGSDKPDTRFGLELEDATRGHPRVGVRCLRRCRGGALPPRPARVLALRDRHARGAGEGARRQGPRLRDPRRAAARSARRSRSSSPRPSSMHSPRRPARPCCSPPTRGR